MATLKDLERSQSLLFDAIQGVPKSDLSRTEFSPPDEEMSSIFSTTYNFNQSLFQINRKDVSKVKRSNIGGMSFIINADEISAIIDKTFDEESFLLSGSNSLYKHFQLTFEQNNNPEQVFDAIVSFIEICENTIEAMSKINKPLSLQNKEALTALLGERDSWRLIHALYKDRELNETSSGGAESLELSFPVSEKQVAAQLYRTNSVVRECQIIIDWLERVCRDHWKSHESSDVAHFTDKTVCWENTLHEIQNYNDVAFPSTRPLVSALDPDAPSRQNKSLHDLDLDDQERLLAQMLKEVRMGRLDRAQELCMHCGQAWRAALLEGWRLYHDPNYQETTERVCNEGNTLRGVWKWACQEVCETGSGLGSAERAVLGALCGHLEATLGGCRSWEDHLWAHTRVAVDVIVERTIREKGHENHLLPLPDKYWNSYMSLEEVFSKLRGQTGLRSEAESPQRRLQELLCLDRAEELTTLAAEWVQIPQQPHLLRFVVHVLLVLRLCGHSLPQTGFNAVLRAYVKILTTQEDPELLVYYLAMLDHSDQVEEFSNFLENISEVNEKTAYLKAALQHNLDLPEITKRIVKLKWNKLTIEGKDADMNEDTSDADTERINALDWLMFHPPQRSDAIISANVLIRSFIVEGKVEAARLAFLKVPDNSVDVVLAEFNCVFDGENILQTENLPTAVNLAIKEYLCYKAYLDAHKGFAEWVKLFHSKPSLPRQEHPDDTSKDLAVQMQIRNDAKSYSEKIDLWKADIQNLSKEVRSQLYNVLLFPDKGWLVDTTESDDELRKSQLDSVRKICIPEIVVFLHTLLHKMELYEDCLDLCTVVMSEKNGIYKVFNEDGLKDLMSRIVDSSVKLTCQNTDPFGMLAAPDNPAPLELTL